jgi:hypothetical protein
MSTGARLGILASIIAFAILALVVASGGSDNKSSTTSSSTTTATQSTGTGTTTTTTTQQAKPAGPPTYTVVVKGAKPVGGVKKVTVKKGDTVNLVVKSDVADEIHIHGYDVHKTVKAGGSVRFRFKASIDGKFEIELEGRKEQIAELTVEP